MNQAEELLLDALEASGTLDAGVVERLCAAHPALDGALRLAHAGFARAHAALHGVAGRADLRALDGEPIAGRFRALEEIGRGGMSVVIAAWDRHLRRKVALKCVRAAAVSAAHLARRRARLENEAQVLAQLDHPGIVPVFDVVRDARGEPYVAMQRVRGVDLREVFRRHWRGDAEWSLLRVIGVLQRTCEAVAFAHDKGVLHRDLKPANVMVGSFGETFVMDWGLARTGARGERGERADRLLRPEPMPHDPAELEPVLDEGAASLSLVVTDRDDSGSGSTSALFTQDGDVLGTPSYMSPEQASGHRDAIDARVDVYGMGAMLYELLARHAPYTRPGESSSSAQVLAELRRGPPAPLQRLARRAPAELVAIAERAMARERGDRYPTMRALADELRAYLEGRVVRAHRTGAFVELRKWIGRNRLAAAALALVAAGTAVFAVVQTQQSQALAANVAELREREYQNQMGLAGASLRTGDVAEAHRLLHAARPEYRGWEWHCLAREFERSTWSAQTNRDWTMKVAFSEDGAQLAVAVPEQGGFAIWNTTTGAPSARSAPRDDDVHSLQGFANGRLLALREHEAAVEVDARTFEVLEPALVTDLRKVHGARPTFSVVGRRIFGLVRDPARGRLYALGEDGRVSIWSLPGGVLLGTLERHGAAVHDFELFAAGHRAITVSLDGTARTWDVDDRRELLRLEGSQCRIDRVGLDPEGRRALCAGDDGTLWLCDVETGARLADLPRVASKVHQIRWSRTLPVVAVASGAFVRLFDTRTWEELRLLVGHLQTVLGLALAPDGSTLASVSIEGGVRVWDLARLTAPSLLAQQTGIYDAVWFDPESGECVLVLDDGDVRVLDPTLSSLRQRFRVPGIVRDSGVSPDGGWLATVGIAGSARINDVRTGALVREFPAPPERFDQCSVLRHARRAFLMDKRSRVSAVDVETGIEVWSARPLGDVPADGMIISGNGRRLVVTSAGQVAVLATADGRTEWARPLRESRAEVSIQDVTRDGGHALLRTVSGTIELVDLDDGSSRWSLSSGTCVFDAAETRVLACGPSGDLVVLDARTGQRIVNLPPRSGPLAHLAVAPDGESVVAISRRGVPILWQGTPAPAPR